MCIYLSVDLHICLSICLSILILYLSICLFNLIFAYLSVYLSIYICPFFYLYLSICLSICLSSIVIVVHLRLSLSDKRCCLLTSVNAPRGKRRLAGAHPASLLSLNNINQRREEKKDIEKFVKLMISFVRYFDLLFFLRSCSKF